MTPSLKLCCNLCWFFVNNCKNFDCSCHQAKPDTFYVDARTPEERKNDAGIKSVTTTSSPEVSPEKKETFTNPNGIEGHSLLSPEKEKGKCDHKNCSIGDVAGLGDKITGVRYSCQDTPTLTEQKGEDKIAEILRNRIKNIGDNEQTYIGYPQELIEELTDYLNQVVAQKEQAVKAEIVKKAVSIVHDVMPDYMIKIQGGGNGCRIMIMAEGKIKDDLLSLLSDKVNH